MTSEKLQVILDRSGEPPGGGASGRNGFESFNASGQRVSTERSHPTCLVVEDDHTMRHLVMNYLAEHDVRAISASGRDEVAGLLVREEPSLVILDLRLGQEDGLDLLREIRSPLAETPNDSFMKGAEWTAPGKLKAAA